MNDSQERYFLPENYTHNSFPSTNDAISGSQYWTPRRVRVASYYQYQVYQEAYKLIKNNKLESVIDIGCGVAKKLEPLKNAFPSLKIAGIDQAHPIKYCSSKYDFGDWVVDDFDSPDVGLWPQSDLVICADVIEHVSDPDILLSAMHEICGKDGLLLISTPDRDRLYGPGKLEPGQKDHVREWSGDEFKSYLKSRGWEVLNQKHSLPVRPLPTITLARELWKQVKAGKNIFYNQLCIARPINVDNCK